MIERDILREFNLRAVSYRWRLVDFGGDSTGLQQVQWFDEEHERSMRNCKIFDFAIATCFFILENSLQRDTGAILASKFGIGHYCNCIESRFYFKISYC